MTSTSSTTPGADTDLPRNRIVTGDAAEQMARLPQASVDVVFFSPPYFGLRDYGVGREAGELGQETNIDQWVHNLLGVCRQAARVLTPTGSLWLNLGDTWSDAMGRGAPRKSLLLGPERLVLALSREGWLVRNKIVWAKTNHLPCSVNDRLTSAWEPLYFLTRRPQYFFDLDAIRQPHTSQPRRRQPNGSRRPAGRHDQTRPTLPTRPGQELLGSRNLGQLNASGLVGHPLGKNPGDVWAIPASGYQGQHRATMPVELARRAIAAACPERRCTNCYAPWVRDTKLTRQLALQAHALANGNEVLRPEVPLHPTCQCSNHDGRPAPTEPGIVIDPFLGSGTTAIAAEAAGRDWLGIELNPKYARETEERIVEERNRREQA